MERESSRPVWSEKKLPNVYKSCPKIISLEKSLILTHFQTLPKNVGDLGKLIVTKGFKSCPKSKKLPNLVTLLTTSNSFEKWIFMKKQGCQKMLCNSIREMENTFIQICSFVIFSKELTNKKIRNVKYFNIARTKMILQT